MTKVFSAHAVSVDGYISGRTPDGDEEFGRGLGDAPALFDWYMDGDTPSQVFDGSRRCPFCWAPAAASSMSSRSTCSSGCWR